MVTKLRIRLSCLTGHTNPEFGDHRTNSGFRILILVKKWSCGASAGGLLGGGSRMRTHPVTTVPYYENALYLDMTPRQV